MSRDGRHLFTSESVTEGHPDKIADQISDSVLDAILAQDAKSRVACETLVTTGLVVMAGEITTNAIVDFQEVARAAIRDVGYTRAKYGFDADTCARALVAAQAVARHQHGRRHRRRRRPGPHVRLCLQRDRRADAAADHARAQARARALVRAPRRRARLPPPGRQVAGDGGVRRPQADPRRCGRHLEPAPRRRHQRSDARRLRREDHQSRRARQPDGQEHQNLRQPDRPLRRRRTARRCRRHRTQDHRRHLRRRRAARRRRVLGKRSHEGRPLGVLHGALHREELRRRRLRAKSFRCSSPTPSASPIRSRSWSTPTAPARSPTRR